MSVSNLPWIDFGMKAPPAWEHHHTICSSLMERSIYLFMKGSRQCCGMGRGHVCGLFFFFSPQDETEIQLAWCVVQKDADSDGPDDTPEKPEWGQLGLCSWSTCFTSCYLGRKGDCSHSQPHPSFRSTCLTRVPDYLKIFSCWVWKSNPCMFSKEYCFGGMSCNVSKINYGTW